MVFYFYSAAVMFLVPYKKRVVDSSGHLWRKRQVTPGDHLEGIGGKKLLYTLVGQRRNV